MQEGKFQLGLSILFASIFVLLLVVAAFMLFRIYLKRKNKLLLEKERMNIEFEQTLLKSRLEIQEQTFAHISREMHDNLGQVLSLISIHLNTLKGPHDPDKIQLMDNLVTKAITDMRNLSHSLDADYIRNNGWAEPVSKLLDDLRNTGKYSTQCLLDDDLPSLGNEKPIILFRMIQEVINNIIKHARANALFFKAKKENDRVIITIRDNGQGFDRDKIREGSGLRNLENRSKMINAGITIESEQGLGTLVTISIKPDNCD
jgi:signal transduction histidine kinase